MLPATAYGRHGALVLLAARAAAPAAFSAEEHALADAFAALPEPAADLAIRLAQRRREEVAAEACADGALAAAIAAGWIAPVAAVGAVQLRAAFAPAPAVRVAATPAVRRLLRGALAVAFADEVDDLSLFPRLALGQIALPPDGPLAAALAGTFVHDGPHPLATRAALDAWLAARTAREEGPSPAAFARALADVEAASGAPLPLAPRLDPLRLRAELLWDCLTLPGLGEVAVARALRALRRAPLPPSLARRVWSETWRRQPRPDLQRRLARACATWTIWRPGEAERWTLRGEGRRAPRDEPWPVAVLPAWLAKDGAQVRAEGVAVERRALDHLAARGLRGIHAEGGFWLALACLLQRDALAARVPGAWPGPLQLTPLDWGAPLFAARRRAALDAAGVAIARDAPGALAAAFARSGGAWLAGSVPPPDPDAAAAVCRLLPRGTLVALCRRLITDPGAASGLPDLVAWSADRLELWEVKSPGDQLSDRQRAWLAWFHREGVSAGVLRLAARQPEQRRLFASSTPPSPATPAPMPARTVVRRARAAPAPALALWAGGALACTPHATLPGGLRLGAEPVVWAERVHRVGAVDGWARAVVGVAALAVDGVLAERRGRRAMVRRVFPLPAGWTLPALLVDEADPAGGIARFAVLVARPSGWLVPRTWAAVEPVVLPVAELETLAPDAPIAWLAHPPLPPPDAEAEAARAGYGDALAVQLALVASTPHAVRADADGATILLPPDAAVLWTVTDPRIRRGVLEIPQSPVPSPQPRPVPGRP